MFQIIYSPFRLAKDIQEFAKLSQTDILVQSTDDPSVASVMFQSYISSYGVDNSPIGVVPNRFLVIVPKYYPHAAPTVKCLDRYIIGDQFDENGNSNHPNFHSGWNALCSLDQVVSTLREIRELCKYSKTVNNMNMDCVRMDNS